MRHWSADANDPASREPKAGPRHRSVRRLSCRGSAAIQDPRARFDIADARNLPEDLASYDVAVSALVLNFIPEVSRATAEIARVVRPGGVVAGYVWDYGGQMERMRYFWDAAVALKPEGLERDEGRRFPICKPGPLKNLSRERG